MMKKALSMILAVCMLISLVPASFAASATDEVFTYSFRTNDVEGASNVQWTDASMYPSYATTGDTYMFVEANNYASDSWGKGFNSGYICHNLRVGRMAVYKIKLPRTGQFDVKFDYYDKNGGIYEMYMLPVTDTEYASASAEVTAVGKLLGTPVLTGIDHTTKGSKIKSAEGSYTADAAGEHYVVFKATTAGYLRGAKLTLTLVTKLGEASVILDENEIYAGEYAYASVTAKNNYGSPFPLEGAEITYMSSDESVATVDETGEILALSAGETEISARVSSGGNTVTSAGTKFSVLSREIPSAIPEDLTFTFPQGFIHKGDSAAVIVKDASGKSYGGITYEYEIEDTSIASEKGGVFTATKVGKTAVSVIATLGEEKRNFAFDLVAVGENLFTRNGVRHGEFENYVFFTDNSLDGVTRNDCLWDVGRNTGRDDFDYEFIDAKSPTSGRLTRILKASVDMDGADYKLFWMQQNNTTHSAKKHAGLIPLEYGKIYEFSGNVKLDNVIETPKVEALSYYYAGGVASSYRQGTVTDIFFENNEGNMDWATFATEPICANWAESDMFGDITFRTGENNARGYDVYVSEFSYHEVSFDSVVFSLADEMTDVSTYDTFETSFVPISGTGKVIKSGKTDAAFPVVYSTSNPTVARVDENGVITAVSDGECEIYADVTIGDVTRRGVLSISLSGLEVMFESIKVSVPSDSVSAGDTMQTDVALYNTDMSEASDEGVIWYYESSDPSVVAVGTNGQITAKAPGKAEITVFAKTEKVIAKDSITITVSDNSVLVSASVKGASIVEQGYSIQLSATALHESGNAADMDNCEVNFSLADGATEGILSVSEDGTVTGISLGTSYVVAEVKKGNTVYSEPYLIEVTEIAPKDIYIDFSARNATAENIITTHATIEKDGYYLDREKTSQTVINSCDSGKKYCYNLAYAMFSRIASIANSVEADTAIVFPVKYSGWYEPIFTGLPMATSGHAHIYLDGKYLGDYDFSAPDKETDGAKISARMNPIYVEGGMNHTLTVRSFKKGADGGTYQYIVSFELDWLVNEPELSELSMSAEDNELIIGETTNVIVTGDMGIGKAYRFGLNHGYIADEENYVVLHSDNEAVVQIVDGVPTAVGEGRATISADVYYKGEQVASPEPITITALAPAFTDVVLSAEKQTFAPYGEGCGITVKAYNSKGEELVIPEDGIVFESSDSNTASVDENGFITPLASSNETCEIRATVTIDGLVRQGTLTVTVREGKVASTYYTEERVANARENIAAYKWAKSTMNTAVKNADKYLPYVDEIYDMIHSQGILRSNFVGVKEDPNFRYCRYCGADLVLNYNRFAWSMNPLSRPWKIQCPDCKRVFPSNDFESFYENGLNEHGEFDRTYALEQNGILCGRGERDEESGEYIVYEQFADNPYGYGDPNGNLFNETYPEFYNPNNAAYGIDPRTKDPITHGWGDFELPHAGYIWGVDDSLGYETGRTCTNAGDREVHTYIAVYSFLGLWTQRYEKNSAIIEQAIEAFRDAYIYTGDVKYARAGIVLLDRIADYYPTYNTMENLNHGFMAGFAGSKALGNIIGHTWEGYLVSTYMEAYDAFFDVYDDPWVVNYLSKTAIELNNTEINDKTTPEKIRKNFELNVMDRVLDDVKRGTIQGNFGLYHRPLAEAAVIYDTYPRTAELLEFLMQRGTADSDKGCTGGNITRKLVDIVEREAITFESSPGYNKIMPQSLLTVAKILSIYEENTNPDTNLYKNPKFIKALKMVVPYITVTVVANISDNSGTGAFGFSSMSDLELAGWEATKQPIFAQLLYFGAKGNLENIRGDIFTKNPEGIQDEIKAVIEKYGEYDYTKSGITTGFGIAHLKGGIKFTTTDSNALSNRLRDFWIYFGSSPIGHNHNDTLHLGIEAFGLDMSPDFGYPAEMVGAGATKRHNWDSATASHNTVMVNDMQQVSHREGGIPHHFDDAGDIQVMDVDAPQAYPNITDVYRRTVVSVDIDDTVSYALDFFRIVGGDEHLYSFHAQSQNTEVTGVELIPQTIGTYAGPDVPYAEDTYYDKEDGFNFIYNVERARMPGTGTFTADFDVDMLRNAKPLPEKDWHLRLTQLNDFDITEVALADGKPPVVKQNPDHFDYIFVRRSGKDLDTLFTSVIEPYIGDSNIESMERLSVSRRDGKPMRGDEPVAAVKIKLKNGRTDYVVYAANNEVTYNVADKFDFTGFVGVCSEDVSGNVIRRYIMDGTQLDTLVSEKAALTGTITDFTKGLPEATANEETGAIEYHSYIEMTLDNDIDTEKLDVNSVKGKLIEIENVGERHGVYVIEDAVLDGNKLIIDIEDVSLIRSFADAYDESLGYIYNIEEEQSARIALSSYEEDAPKFADIGELSVSAGSSITVPIKATNNSGKPILFKGSVLPRGMSLNEETGVLTWKPTSSQVGENHVAITASDGVLETTVHFDITVYGSTGGGASGGGGASAPTTPGTSTPTIPATPGATDKPAGSTDNVGTDLPDGPQTPATTERFIDLDNHAWARDAINSLADEGIIKGTSENTFSPAANITRADFAILLVRAFELASESEENFADVYSSDYFAKELAIARNTGLVGGIGENKFAPRNNITRQDMMVIVYRALVAMEKELDVTAISAPDFANVSDYAKDAVAALVNAGLVNGKNGLVDPLANTTRAEVAVLLSRILDFVK